MLSPKQCKSDSSIVDRPNNRSINPTARQVAKSHIGGPALIQRQSAKQAHLKTGVENNSNKQETQQKNETGMPTDLKSGLENLSGQNLSGVKVHRNSSKPAAIQAHAYAQGQDIHLGPGQEKHLPHEGWHVVQQMQGRVKPTIQKKNALINDNAGLEREADVMGAKAIQMKASPNQNSSENTAPILQKRTNSNKTNAPIQMVKSNWGEFKEKNYNAVLTHGANIEIEFHPRKDKVDATKIGLTQTVNNKLGSNDFSLNPTRAEQRVKAGEGKGSRIDRISTNQNPIYGGNMPSVGDTLKDTTTGSNAQIGWHYFDHSSGTAVEKTKEAILKDKPTMPGSSNNSSQTFETVALAIKGTQKDQYMGSVEWGWKKDGSGTFSLLPFVLKTDSSPTAGFFNAGELWNSSKAQGTIEVSADPATAYKWSGGFVADSYTLPKTTTVTLEAEGAYTMGPGYNKVKITSGTKIGTITYLRVKDMKDTQDGAATMNLPIEDIKLTTAAITQELGAGVSGPPLTIPMGTRVKEIAQPVGTGNGILEIVGNTHNGVTINVTKADFAKLKKER